MSQPPMFSCFCSLSRSFETPVTHLAASLADPSPRTLVATFLNGFFYFPMQLSLQLSNPLLNTSDFSLALFSNPVSGFLFASLATIPFSAEISRFGFFLLAQWGGVALFKGCACLQVQCLEPCARLYSGSCIEITMHRIVMHKCTQGSPVNNSKKKWQENRRARRRDSPGFSIAREAGPLFPG